MLLLEHWY